MVSKNKTKVKGNFKTYTKEESVADRIQYIESLTTELIKDSFTIQEYLAELNYLDSIIDFRDTQLKAKHVMELFEGTIKTERILISELSKDKLLWNKLFHGYSKLREKLVKVYNLTDNIITNEILEGKFNFTEWQENRLNDETAEQSKV